MMRNASTEHFRGSEVKASQQEEARQKACLVISHQTGSPRGRLEAGLAFFMTSWESGVATVKSE